MSHLIKFVFCGILIVTSFLLEASPFSQFQRHKNYRSRYITPKPKITTVTPKPSFGLAVYDNIKDIYHPTLEDYYSIQNYLSTVDLTRLKDYEYRARSFRLIGNNPDEIPQSGMIAVNCEESEKENCLLVYASYNNNYPKGLKRLVQHVSESNFKGHILWRIGGWPNAEGGSLVLAHVPYAYKASFFKEAQRLGYKRAFWLDTSTLPIVSLNDIFDIIAEKGYFVLANSHNVGPYMDSAAAEALGFTLDATYNIPSCSAGITGFDFTNPLGLEIVDTWYQAAKDPFAFYSSRSDQNALSLILWAKGAKDLISFGTLAHGVEHIHPGSLILIERSYVHH